jgi:competence protein ComEC
MGAAGIAAMTVSRPASRWYALLLAAVVTLALNPRASGDPGWQLSFAAVAGILTLGPPLQRGLRWLLGAAKGSRLGTSSPVGRVSPADRVSPAGTSLPAGQLVGRLAEGLVEGGAITVAATLATAPLLAHHFQSVPLAGLPANLLALPAVAPAMWLGMVKAGLGQLAAVVPPADFLARAMGAVAHAPVAYLAGLAERFADLPGGQVAVPLGSPVRVVGAYALSGAAAVGAARAARALGARGDELAATWRRRPRAQRLAVAAAVLAALSLAAVRVISGPRAPDELTVRFSTSARATARSSSIPTARRCSSTAVRPRRARCAY